jgi:hypothetical protein
MLPAILSTALPHPAAMHFHHPKTLKNLHMALMPIQPKALIPVNKALIADAHLDCGQCHNFRLTRHQPDLRRPIHRAEISWVHGSQAK